MSFPANGLYANVEVFILFEMLVSTLDFIGEIQS